MNEVLGNRGYPTLFCTVLGHKWRTFDANWRGKDYQMCRRIGLFPLRCCGATRQIDTPEASHDR